MDPIILASLISTAAMTGLIWFVQVVHYPLFEAVGRDTFVEYERRHTVLTTYVVMPLMFVELGTSLWLACHPPAGRSVDYQISAVLVVLVWLSTFFLQVPKHRVLETQFDKQTWRSLVRSNWIRTILWTAHLAIMCVAVLR